MEDCVNREDREPIPILNIIGIVLFIVGIIYVARKIFWNPSEIAVT